MRRDCGGNRSHSVRVARSFNRSARPNARCLALEYSVASLFAAHGHRRASTATDTWRGTADPVDIPASIEWERRGPTSFRLLLHPRLRPIPRRRLPPHPTLLRPHLRRLLLPSRRLRHLRHRGRLHRPLRPTPRRSHRRSRRRNHHHRRRRRHPGRRRRSRRLLRHRHPQHAARG